MAKASSRHPGKITVECPHCGFKQLESVYAKTTLCRKCGDHIDLEKRNAELPEHKTSVLQRLGSLISRDKIRDIRCFECGSAQQVSGSAKSSICPHCSSYIDLRDLKINTPFTRHVQTAGAIHVTSKGDITSTRVACGEALIQGKVHGNLLCSGTVTMKLKGKFLGALDARHLMVEKGADIEFVRPAKIRSAEIKGKVSARLLCDGVVTVRKSGSLEGTVYAKSIVVDRGGIFHGELYIGKQELAQAELIPEQPAAPPPDLFSFPPKQALV